MRLEPRDDLVLEGDRCHLGTMHPHFIRAITIPPIRLDRERAVKHALPPTIRVIKSKNMRTPRLAGRTDPIDAVLVGTPVAIGKSPSFDHPDAQRRAKNAIFNGTAP